MGVIKSRSEVRKRVVISAHQDAAYEFNIWWLFRDGGVPAMVLSIGCLIFPFVTSVFGMFSDLQVSSVDDHHMVVALMIWPFVSLNFMFHSDKIVPGAMDNLAGICVLMGLSPLLKNRLENTEVVLLATSGEECGLRGAKAYVEAHQEELDESAKIKTRGIFVDGIYDERCLTIVTRELTTRVKHDPHLVSLAEKSAQALGFSFEKAIIPFGATDASAFGGSGIPSISILCQDTHRLVHNYHTRDDTFDLVRPQSLSTMLRLVYSILECIDHK